MAETYFVMPGNTICKAGLPGGKLECKAGKEPLEIKENLIPVIKKNLFHWQESGAVKTRSQIEEAAKKAESEEKAEEERKKAQTAAKVQALVDELKGLGVDEKDIPKDATQAALKKLIEAKKADQ